MKCPDCNNLLIEKRIIDQPLYSVNVDECVICGGLWFDANELEAYRACVLPTTEYTVLPDITMDTNVDTATCCCCERKTLQSCYVGEHLIRRCSNCAGIFLNKIQLAELSKLNEQNSSAMDSVCAVLNIVEILGWIIK